MKYLRWLSLFARLGPPAASYAPNLHLLLHIQVFSWFSLLINSTCGTWGMFKAQLYVSIQYTTSMCEAKNDGKVILCRRYILSLCHVGRLFGRLSVCHLCKVASQQISENILFPASSKYPILAPTRSSKYPILAPTGATPLTQAATIWDFHSTQCRNIFSKSLY